MYNKVVSHGVKSVPKASKTSISVELILSHTLPHGARAAHTTRHHLQKVIRVIGTRPFLMCDNFHTTFHLWFLDELTVCAHALLGKGFGESIGDESSLVKTSEGDELPAVAQSTEALNVSFLFVAGHGGLPVKGG
jgi:hypothetical protein